MGCRDQRTGFLLCVWRCTLMAQSKQCQPLILKCVETLTACRPDDCSLNTLLNELHSSQGLNGKGTGLRPQRTDRQTNHTPEYLRKELVELHFSSTKARLEKAGDCWCVSLLPCSRLKSRSVPSKPKYTALSPASGKLTSRMEDVREE